MIGLLTSKYALLAALFLVTVSICGLAYWSHIRHTPTPPHVERHGPYEIAEVTSGASLVVKTGILGRKRETVTLDWIACEPIETPAGMFAYGNLAALSDFHDEKLVDAATGKPVPQATVTVEVLTARRMGRPDLVGEVFSKGGQNLNLAQVEAGWARCHTDAPKAYQQAQKAAQKARRGIWAKAKETTTEDAEGTEEEP